MQLLIHLCKNFHNAHPLLQAATYLVLLAAMVAVLVWWNKAGII